MLVSINEYYGTRKVEPPLQNVYDVDFANITFSFRGFISLRNRKQQWYMAEVNTCPLQHQLLPSKSIQTVVCRQNQNIANWIQC